MFKIKSKQWPTMCLDQSYIAKANQTNSKKSPDDQSYGMTTCTDNNGDQTWRFLNGRDGMNVLQNVKTGQCLDSGSGNNNYYLGNGCDGNSTYQGRWRFIGNQLNQGWGYNMDIGQSKLTASNTSGNTWQQFDKVDVAQLNAVNSPAPAIADTPNIAKIGNSFARGSNYCMDAGQWDVQQDGGTNSPSWGTSPCDINNIWDKYYINSNNALVNMATGNCLDAAGATSPNDSSHPWKWNNCNETDWQTGFSIINNNTQIQFKRGSLSSCIDFGNPNKNYTCTSDNKNQLFSTLNLTEPTYNTTGPMVCQDTESTICCPANNKITSGRIKYGRWDNTTCGHATVSATTGKSYAYIPLPDSCLGNQSCDIKQDMLKTPSGNTDPAFGVYKQYQVSYNCTPIVTPTPSPMPRPSGLPSGAPFTPPTPTPSPAPGPSDTKTYTFYFDVPCNSTAASTCLYIALTGASSGNIEWHYCNTNGSPNTTYAQSWSNPVMYPNNSSIAPPDNTYFTAWNLPNPTNTGANNVSISVSSSCSRPSNSGRYCCNGNPYCTGHGDGNCDGHSCSGSDCKGWKTVNNKKHGNDTCPCNSNNGSVQNFSLSSAYYAYKPLQKFYWYTSCNATASTPTFLQFIASNGTIDSSDSANVSPAYAVYTVIYKLKYPSEMIPDELDLMLTQIGKVSFTAWTINKNSQTVQTLLLDYCNNFNNGLYLTTKLTSTGKTLCGTNIMSYFVNSPATPPSGYPKTDVPSNITIPTSLIACDTSYTDATGCKTGWMNYCNQPATFTSNACQNFYSGSYNGTTLDNSIRTNLKNLCATITMTNGVLNDTIDPTVQSVCGCYLPESVYTAFKSQVTQNNPQLASAMTQPQCYYSMCSGNPSLWPDKGIKCPDLTITQCINNVTNNLNAGGNISNVKLANNSVMNCSANSGSVPSPCPSPAAATGTATSTGNSTPVAATSSGASTPASSGAASPATPAESPASPATTPSPAHHWYDACSIM